MVQYHSGVEYFEIENWMISVKVKLKVRCRYNMSTEPILPKPMAKWLVLQKKCSGSAIKVPVKKYGRLEVKREKWDVANIIPRLLCSVYDYLSICIK